MKKKSPRGIPDFSSKRPLPGSPAKLNTDRQQRPVPPPIPRVKPPAGSAKSGRRGQ